MKILVRFRFKAFLRDFFISSNDYVIAIISTNVPHPKDLLFNKNATVKKKNRLCSKGLWRGLARF